MRRTRIFLPQTLTYSLINEPAGATIDSNTGVFSWTPAEAQGPNDYILTVEVSDGALADTEEITITVNEVNESPVLTAIGDQSIDELSELTFTASATDPDLPAQVLTYSLVGQPSGASINASGAFSWTPTEAQGPDSYTFTVQVSDGTLTDSKEITVTVNEVNAAPLLGAIGNMSVNEETALMFTASAIDSDVPVQSLSYSLVSAPAGASINPTSGVFTWTPTEAQGPDSYAFTVQISDGIATDSESITVTVIEPIQLDIQMVQIPAGQFIMGDVANVSPGNGLPETPVHSAEINAFKIGKYELTYALWVEVYDWALTHGYDFDNPGKRGFDMTTQSSRSAGNENHPVSAINWYDAVKWCNAASEMAGLEPVYYTDDNFAMIYQSGQHNVLPGHVKIDANGYRLPTETEWEKAARGGLVGEPFSWGSDFNYSHANFWYPSLGWSNGTVPIGSYGPNGHGVFDTDGNVNEWAFDIPRTYTSEPVINPLGESSGQTRVMRGTGWSANPPDIRISVRIARKPSEISNVGGMRIAQSIPIVNNSAELWLNDILPANTPKSLRALDADADFDHVSNLMEYAMGMNPGFADSQNLMVWGINPTAKVTELDVQCRADDPALTFICAVSQDLESWKEITLSFDSDTNTWSTSSSEVEISSQTDLGNGIWKLTLRDASGFEPVFMRMELIYAP